MEARNTEAGIRKQDQITRKRLKIEGELEHQHLLDGAEQAKANGNIPAAEAILREAGVPEDDIPEQLAAARVGKAQRGMDSIVSHFTHGRPAALERQYARFARLASAANSNTTQDELDDVFSSIKPRHLAGTIGFLQGGKAVKSVDELIRRVGTYLGQQEDDADDDIDAAEEALDDFSGDDDETVLEPDDVDEEEELEERKETPKSKAKRSTAIPQVKDERTHAMAAMRDRAVRVLPTTTLNPANYTHATLTEMAKKAGQPYTGTKVVLAERLARAQAYSDVKRVSNPATLTRIAAEGKNGTYGRGDDDSGLQLGYGLKPAAAKKLDPLIPFGEQYMIDSEALDRNEVKITSKLSRRPIASKAGKAIMSNPSAAVIYALRYVLEHGEVPNDKLSADDDRNMRSLVALSYNRRTGSLREPKAAKKTKAPKAAKAPKATEARKPAPVEESDEEEEDALEEPEVLAPVKGLKLAPEELQLQIWLGEMGAGNDAPEQLEKIATLARKLKRTKKITPANFKFVTDTLNDIEDAHIE